MPNFLQMARARNVDPATRPGPPQRGRSPRERASAHRPAPPHLCHRRPEPAAPLFGRHVLRRCRRLLPVQQQAPSRRAAGSRRRPACFVAALAQHRPALGLRRRCCHSNSSGALGRFTDLADFALQFACRQIDQRRPDFQFVPQEGAQQQPIAQAIDLAGTPPVQRWIWSNASGSNAGLSDQPTSRNRCST